MLKNVLKFIFILLVILLCSFYVTIIEPNKLIINEYDLYIPNWDKKLDGLRVLTLSDLHIGSSYVSTDRLEKIVNKINTTPKDIVIILGDFDAKTISQKGLEEKTSEVLAQINAPKGVFAIYGNHDYEPRCIIGPILQKAGIKILADNGIKISQNNASFTLFGIHDIWHYKSNPRHLLQKSIQPVIFLSHNPDIFPEVPANVSLTLSGHTHGGEIMLPILGALFIPSKYCHRYAKGYVIEDGKHLFVTSGIATTGYFRSFNPPEIIVLNLYSENKTKNKNVKNKFSHGLSDFFAYYNKRKF